MNVEKQEREFKIIIAGGRDFNDYETLKQTLDYYLQNVNSKIVIFSGNARGTDSLGERYAKEKGYNLRLFPADWHKHGKAAGPIRNEEMAKEADALVAFWDGKSRGTKSMIELAKKHKLLVRIKKY